MNIWSLLSPFSFKLPILSIFLGRRIHTNQLRIRMFGQFYACVLWMRSIFNAKYKILFSSITLAVQFLLKKMFSHYFQDRKTTKFVARPKWNAAKMPSMTYIEAALLLNAIVCLHAHNSDTKPKCFKTPMI